MPSTRRPAWPAVMLISGAIASTGIWAGSGLASAGPVSTGPASTGPASTGPASTGPASTGPASTAFGPSSQDKFLSQALHWNGRTWSRTVMSQPGGTGAIAENELAWVTCSPAGNCWAVGGTVKAGSSTVANEILHWNG